MPNTHSTYDEEFRRNALELFLQSNRPLKRVAHEPGVAANSLRNWRDRFLGKRQLAKRPGRPITKVLEFETVNNQRVDTLSTRRGAAQSP
ncbi:MAG: transposase [Verrucomicrobiae bacterium]|nr:transposase [Verrucomicrobiae bacterium]